MLLDKKKDDSHFLRMYKRDDSHFIKISIGTKIQIKKATQSYSPVSGYYSKYIEGSIHVKELNRNVNFHFSWRKKEYHSDEKYYYVFKIAPWQDEPLPYKFDLENNKIPYDKDSEDKLLKIIDLENTIRNKGTNNLRQFHAIDSTINSYQELEIKYKFNYFNNALDNFDYSQNLQNKTFFLSKEEIAHLGLKSIDNDLSTTRIFPVGNMEISDTFTQRILSFVKENKEINVKLINFSEKEEIIDTLTIFQFFKGEKRPRKYTSIFNKKIRVFMATDKHILKNPAYYHVNEKGKIISE